jgi:DME family drug/metabolite transporter
MTRARTGSQTGSIPIAPEGAVSLVAISGRAAAPTWLVIALGTAGVVAYQPTFFLGASLNGVAVGTIVALGSAPIITGALEWAVTRVFPGRIWLAATLVATVGVVLLTGVGGTDAVSVEGLAASLGAGASYGVYGLASKRLLVRGWTPTAAMGSVFGWAAAASVPLLLLTDLRWLGTADGVAMALWLGLATTTVGYLLYARGLIGLSAATVSTLTLAEPLTATLLGILLLGERLSGSAVAGIIVLATGLVLLVLPRRAPAAEA